VHSVPIQWICFILYYAVKIERKEDSSSLHCTDKWCIVHGTWFSPLRWLSLALGTCALGFNLRFWIDLVCGSNLCCVLVYMLGFTVRIIGDKAFWPNIIIYLILFFLFCRDRPDHLYNVWQSLTEILSVTGENFCLINRKGINMCHFLMEMLWGSFQLH
jgi:hypothetical protein